jgi:hypothetical protein
MRNVPRISAESRTRQKANAAQKTATFQIRNSGLGAFTRMAGRHEIESTPEQSSFVKTNFD